VLQKIRENLHNERKGSKVLKKVNHYHMGLLVDEAGKQKKFEVSEENLPSYLRKKVSNDHRKNFHVVINCRTVEDWLNVFRNQVTI